MTSFIAGSLFWEFAFMFDLKRLFRWLLILMIVGWNIAGIVYLIMGNYS